MDDYQRVRRQTEALCEPLAIEDYVLQSMPDASPARWHLAHTTWFFETFVLVPYLPDYQRHEPAYEYLFNSYYNGVGDQYPRHLRGLLSRPTVAEVRAWRRAVDDAMGRLLGEGPPTEALELVTIGLNHEQQHQELLVTDVKHALAQNPLDPVYDAIPRQLATHRPPERIAFDRTIVEIGHGGDGFHFDNEGPRHEALVPAHGLSSELVTNGEWLAFIEDGGYGTHDLWLSDGWALAQAQRWRAPLYWQQGPEGWTTFTLSGRVPVDLHAPVTHISFFEADAYARWAGARLPTEFEWERAAQVCEPACDGTFVEDGALHPVGAAAACHGGVRHLFGEVWEWTSSPYRPYPGYRAPAGAIGEYNGKFMNACYVLRGGSCATPRDHIRATYRNFFGPDKRWQFTGLRLAYDA